MRLLRPIVFVCALVPSIVSAQATGSVSGHVLCSDTRTPCRFATITLQSVDSAARTSAKSRSQPKDTGVSRGVAGFDGSYLINGVAAGDYYVLAALPGYLNPVDQLLSDLPADASFSQEILDKLLPRVTITPNRQASADITMQRGASLSGTVRYDDGGLAIGFTIEVYLKDKNGQWKRYANRGGNEPLSAIGAAVRTDDRGHFYEPALPHGTYIVEAHLQEFIPLPLSITYNEGAIVSDQRQNALRIFYGDKFRMKEAKTIELNEGEDRSDVDITITTDGLHTVRGVVNSKSGETVEHGEVSLNDPDDKTPIRTTGIQNDGTFNFNYLPAGTYQITIHGNKGGQQFQPLTTTLVVDNDLSGLSYSVSPATRANPANQ
jgi:hypothetical protein